MGEGGVQKSSTSNHRHSNVFCGSRAPQLVITVKIKKSFPCISPLYKFSSILPLYFSSVYIFLYPSFVLLLNMYIFLYPSLVFLLYINFPLSFPCISPQYIHFPLSFPCISPQYIYISSILPLYFSSIYIFPLSFPCIPPCPLLCSFINISSIFVSIFAICVYFI